MVDFDAFFASRSHFADGGAGYSRLSRVVAAGCGGCGVGGDGFGLAVVGGGGKTEAGHGGVFVEALAFEVGFVAERVVLFAL